MAKKNLFNECPGSPCETYGPESMQAYRRLVCRYEDRLAVVAKLLAGDASMPLPKWYPTDPNCVSVRARVEPFDPDTPGMESGSTENLADSESGQYAQVLGEYEFIYSREHSGPKLIQDSDAGISGPPVWFEYRSEPSGEYIQIPWERAFWDSDHTAPIMPNAAPTLRVPITSHVVTMHRVAAPDWATIKGLRGTVNSTTILGCLPGCLLFDAYGSDPEFIGFTEDDKGKLTPKFGWKLTYFFREKTIMCLQASQSETGIGWNHAFNPTTHAWDKLITTAGTYAFTASDSTILFQQS